jgi:biotin operon repressor
METYRHLVDEQALELAWSLWGELGVRGVVRGRHGQWSIDPEPLIAFTARIGDLDPRLRDESMDWYIEYERYISRARLKSTVQRADPTTQQAFGTYAATLTDHTRGSWPRGTRPQRYERSARSSLVSLTKPNLIRLRLRALFGVAARAEIVHAFIAQPYAQISGAEMAKLTGYTKRNVTEELDRLEVAGLLEVAAPTNQFLYRLHDPTALMTFVGRRPKWFPNWEPTFRVVIALLDGARRADGKSSNVQAIELEKLVSELEPDLRDARMPPPPSDRSRSGRAEELQRWAVQVMTRLAKGRGWPALNPADSPEARRRA